MKKLLLKALSVFSVRGNPFQYKGRACIRCGKLLRSERSKTVGMGATCWMKSGWKKHEWADSVTSNVGMEDLHGSIR
jgi:hypothetical protein